jgi:hypothetical protein
MERSSVQSGGVELKALQTLQALSHEARVLRSLDELSYLFVNASYKLVRYDQSLLWLNDHNPSAASGVISPTNKAPMVQWLADLHRGCLKDHPSGVIEIGSVDSALQERWGDFLPPFAFWLSGSEGSGKGCLLVRNIAWTDSEKVLLHEWWSIWLHSRDALEFSRRSVREPLKTRILRYFNDTQRPWYRRRGVLAALGLLLVMLFPVPMTVIAPGQLVALSPVRVTVPLDGVIRQLEVEPGSVVVEGDVLFRLDDKEIKTRLNTATQALETARASFRQLSQQAMQDARFMARLAEVRGTIVERMTEKEFLERQLDLTVVMASRGGVVTYEPASSLVGEAVSIGDHVMSIIDPEKKELEIWLSIFDAIPLPDDATVRLHLNAAPFSPVEGTLRFVSFDVSERPDGSLAYNLRASLSDQTTHRVGLQGTARISGNTTTMFYWLFRRPISSFRALGGF